MSKGRTIETRTEEVLAPIAEANGVEIYDVEYVKEGLYSGGHQPGTGQDAEEG